MSCCGCCARWQPPPARDPAPAAWRATLFIAAQYYLKYKYLVLITLTAAAGMQACSSQTCMQCMSNQTTITLYHKEVRMETSCLQMELGCLSPCPGISSLTCAIMDQTTLSGYKGDCFLKSNTAYMSAAHIIIVMMMRTSTLPG